MANQNSKLQFMHAPCFFSKFQFFLKYIYVYSYLILMNDNKLDVQSLE